MYLFICNFVQNKSLLKLLHYVYIIFLQSLDYILYLII